MQVLLPPCPFPPLRWMREAIGGATLDIHAHYVKQTWRNRYSVLSVHGPVILTIPVQGTKGQKAAHHSIRIEPGAWQRQHLHTIRSAYGKSAFFEHLEPDLVRLFESPGTFLIDFTRESYEILRPFFPGWRTEESSSYSEPSTGVRDLRPFWEPAFQDTTVYPPYPQVWSDRFGFTPGLSVLDLVMNRGPASMDYILMLKKGTDVLPQKDASSEL